MQEKPYEKMTQSELIEIIERLQKEKEMLERTIVEYEEKKLKEEAYRKLPYIKPPWLQ